ncbi:putative membrane protein [Hydrogenivirga caldilitoris]|uniref:Putative membrane protein n=1 Tax=Hydrogenivirga caldilitoris TaxID=246264 RepID=A0A497XSF5_9AQUI|nr:hypothetical protein [Hydrogenivirga caldilitoris]RLJ71181.1 putative membrane protein [Hydrogenivirga caldilitoris]
MSYFAYPHGYLYPNEFFEPILWLPVMVAYTLLISIASGSAIIGALGVITPWTWFRENRLFFLKLAAATSPVILLGPLADIRHPERGIFVLIYSHIFPSETHPGSSLIAILANLWLPFVLSVWGTLFFLKRKPVVSKFLAYIALFLGAVWSTYYAGLLITADTKLYLYNFLPLLPMGFFLGAILLSVSLYGFLSGRINSLSSKILFWTLVSFLFLRALEGLRLFILFGGTPLLENASKVYSGLNTLSLFLFLLALGLSYLSTFKGVSLLNLLSSVLTIIALVLDRWNIVVNTQLVSKTTLTTLDYNVPLSHWLPEALAFFFFAFGLYALISMKVFERRILGGVENG